MVCVTFLNLRNFISFSIIANTIAEMVPIAIPMIETPKVFIIVCVKSLSLKAFTKLARPTNSLWKIGLLNVAGLTSWKAMVHPQSGMYLKIISQMTNGIDMARRYRCFHKVLSDRRVLCLAFDFLLLIVPIPLLAFGFGRRCF